MKKLMVLAFALILGSRLSFAQGTAGNTGTATSSGHTGQAAASKGAKNGKKSSSGSTTVPSGPTITLRTSQGAVTMKNFYKEALAIVPGYVILKIDFRGAFHYDMGFNRGTRQFTIMINADSLADAIQYRSVAESDFLKMLGVSKSDACKLPVDLRGNPTSPPIANLSEKNYGLSFCPGGVNF